MPFRGAWKKTLAKTSPGRLESGEDQQRFACGQEHGSNDVAGPVGSEINPGITNGRSYDPVEPPAPPEKYRRTHRDDGVVAGVTGGKRWARTIVIRLIRI